MGIVKMVTLIQRPNKLPIKVSRPEFMVSFKNSGGDITVIYNLVVFRRRI